MKWMPAPRSTSLSSLFGTGRDLCFLAGSGVSVDRPSGLPTGLQFMKDLLSELIPEDRLARVLSLTDSEGADAAENGRFLRFEQLVQQVSELDPELKILNRLGACNQPNGNHLALAGFILSGHRVFTTNFDHLIECALYALDVPRACIRPVIFRTDWENDGVEGEHSLYKLHGSLYDLRTGSPSRESVQATVSKIAQRKERGVFLEPWKMGVLRNALESSDLVVVGYSGLDDFDVLPAIQAIPSDRLIIWIEHGQDCSIEHPEISVVGTTDEGADSSRVGQYLLSSIGSSRDAGKLFRVRVNTAEFLTWLAERKLPNRVGTGRCTKDLLQAPSEESRLELSEARKWFFTGEIFSYFDSREALDLFQRSLSLAEADRNSFLAARCMNFMARQYESLIFDVETTDEQKGDYWELGKKNLEAALSIVEALPDPKARDEEATVLNNLGMFCRHLSDDSSIRRAKEYFARALAIDESTQDLRGQARSLNNLGAADYALGELDTAIEMCSRACEIDRSLGDLSELAVHLANLGKFRCDKGDEQGVTDLEEAIEIDRSIGALGAMSNGYNSIGFFYAGKRRWREALRNYELAVEYADRAGIALVTSFRRSAEAVRTLVRDEASAAEGRPVEGSASGGNRTEPACADVNAIVGISLLVPNGQPIEERLLVSVAVSGYRQVNEQLSEQMENAGTWTRIALGYGELPKSFAGDMRSFAYAQALVEQQKGRTVLIQGGLEVSDAGRRSGLPSELWFLTVTRTPSGDEPKIGFVAHGAIAPKTP